MANGEHGELLSKGATIWNRWRKEHPRIRPNFYKEDFSGADLKGVNLGFANLYETNFNGADLTEANLGVSNLSKANFSNARLVGAQLGGGDLNEAIFNGANLSGAHIIESALIRAQLVGADLRRATLSGSYLNRANLTRTLLTETKMDYVNLSRVDLNGADLKETLLLETIFNDVDLSVCKNLELCNHRGASNIDQRTLVKSGPLPKIFLRGCGLSELFIDNIPALFWNNPLEFYSCFISYSHDDKAFARLLYNQLQGRGIRCWLDEHQVFPGDNIRKAIDQGIKLWDKVVLCCSKSALDKSWWVQDEIERALQKEEELFKRRGEKVQALIPITLDTYIFKRWKHEYKAQILARKIADFTGWKRNHDTFEAEFEKVVKALRSDEHAREKPPEPRL